MKKVHLFIFSLVCTFLSIPEANAQMDVREPGLYAIIGEESILLPFTNGVNSVNSTEIMGVDVGKMRSSYKGSTSGINAAKTFVLVINPEKKNISKTLKSYYPFVKSMTPKNMRILPLEVYKNKRIYDEGKTISGINVSSCDRIDFEWEQISDNSFEIRISEDIKPGEYGFVFRDARLADFDYEAIFGFTIAE